MLLGRDVHVQMSNVGHMTRAQLEKRIRKLHRSGMGMMKIGKALGVGTTVERRAIYRASWSPFDASASL